jgi:hypothetical protein
MRAVFLGTSVLLLLGMVGNYMVRRRGRHPAQAVLP